MRRLSLGRVKRVCFKTLVDEVQELEAVSKDPGAVVHGKRYCREPLFRFRFTFHTRRGARMVEIYVKGCKEVFLFCFFLIGTAPFRECTLLFFSFGTSDELSVSRDHLSGRIQIDSRVEARKSSNCP